MKVRDQDSQTPPSQVNVPLVRLYASHNWLAKETQGSGPWPVCLLSVSEHILVQINSHFTFLTSLLHFWILSWWRKNFKFTGNNGTHEARNHRDQCFIFVSKWTSYLVHVNYQLSAWHSIYSSQMKYTQKDAMCKDTVNHWDRLSLLKYCLR